MEDETKPDVDVVNDAAKDRAEKLSFQRELRGLELNAYSSVMQALRASGKPNAEKDSLLKTMRDFFQVSEDRHKAELRFLAYDEKLCEISEKLNGHDFIEEWSFQAQRIYVPLSQPPFSLYQSFPNSFTRTCPSVRDPLPMDNTTKQDEDSDAYSESEIELINSIIKDNPECNGWQPENPKPVTIAVEQGTGNEAEIEEIEQHMKKRQKIKKQPNFTPARSPDITEAPKTPTKSTHVKCESKPSNVVKGRGVKRKESEELSTPQSENVELPSKTLERPKSRLKIRKQNKTSSKLKAPKSTLPLPAETKKSKESSEETSSADEGENGPLLLNESSRVMSPVFSEVIRSSVLCRGRGPRGRGNVERRKNNAITSPSKVKPGKPRPRTPNQKSGKFKISVPTSGSRRKSKLNEKIDYDDVLMDLDGNEMEKQNVYTSKGEEVPRRLLLDSQSFDRIGDSRASFKDFKSSEDCALYAETLPINYNHEDMEQVNDGVFKRPLPPSRGPKPWEIKDARLTLREETISDENNSNNIHYGEIEISHQLHTDVPVSPTNNLDTTVISPPTNKHELPPPPKKQRIKSPLIVNPNINPPNVSKVPLAAPVFSTSLSSVNKKRQTNKPMSVVDSLNLHLPTSATASSLAASSNNRRAGATVGGGCSMFSNSSALIAGARGTAPGILQQQRKAQPHILANSKVHQRAFPPAMNTGSNIVNVNTNILPPIGGAPTFSAGALPPPSPVVSVAPASHAVQIPTSPIPISAISTVPPSSPLPFQSFPTSNSPSLSIAGAGVPMPIVNRTSPGANIIFVQKSNGPAIGGGAPVPNNIMPLKTQPRAVILRRAQLPRQGNLMFLDVHKNHIVTPLPSSPLLQTTRILNAPGELSLLNIQPSSGPIKSPPTPFVAPQSFAPTDVSPGEGLSTHHIQKPEGIVIHTSPETFIANFSDVSQINHQINDSEATTSTILQNQIIVEEKDNRMSNAITHQAQEAPQDAEYAQIEAELMQMEEGSFEEVVYEEEVTTEIVSLEDGGNTQYIYTNDTCATSEGENALTSQEALTHNASSISGSSTDTASENETSINHLESPDNDSGNNSRQALVKKVSLSPIEEMKVASDAVSRALSLSKLSPAKRLTFSAPITLGTTTFSFTGGKSNPAPENLIPSSTTSTINVVPVDFQPTSTTETTLSVADEDADRSVSLQRNTVGSTKSITTVQGVVHNDISQQCDVSAQDGTTSS